MSSHSKARFPDQRERMPCVVVESPHPAVLDNDTLTHQCDLRTQRRSGPGGQHRNKTSSGVFLTHQPTMIVAEATERRSQAHNREVAMLRMRYLLALQIRTVVRWNDLTTEAQPCMLEDSLREKYRGHNLRLNEANVDKPGVLALLLNDLWVAGGQPSLIAKTWGVSTSRVVSFLRSTPEAVALINKVRQHHGRLPLH